MGGSKLEKFYAICVIMTLLMFFGSIMLYRVHHHKLANARSVNDTSTKSLRINWAELYPFAESEDEICNIQTSIHKLKTKYLWSMDGFKKRTNRDANENFLAREKLILTAFKVGKDLRWPQIEPKALNAVTEMSNGYLVKTTDAVPIKDINEIADSVMDFKNFLSGENIAFIYVNAGYKVNPQDRQLSESHRDYPNENSSNLLRALQDKAIDVIDFRTELLNSGLDWYKAYYISDHHWTNAAQLWAASVLANKLNWDYGFHFDLSCFDKNNYDCTTYEKIFLGYHGREKADLRYLEDYEMILPKFDTEFEIEIPARDIHLTGEYKNTLVDLKLLEKITHYSESDFLIKPDAYSVTQIRNEDKAALRNKKQTHNEGKKILMLQDSFGWYLAGYLAMDIPEIDVIHLPNFGGSIRTYIKQTRPDVVILLYYLGSIEPINWNKHTSQFDLR